MFKVKIHPTNKEVLAEKDSVLLDVLLLNHIEIANYCGGNGSCKKCIVSLLEGQLSEDSRFGDYYLACKAQIKSDVVIEIINLEDLRKCHSEDFNFTSEGINHFVENISLEVAPPCINDKTPDLDRLINAINGEYYLKSKDLISKLPDYLRKNDWKISLVADKKTKNIIDLSVVNKADHYGIAVDIGTTTVNMILVDLNTGKIIDSESSYNRQISCGADVISRIIFAEKDNGLEKLHRLIIQNINELLELILARNDINSSNIYTAVFSGNNTMIHLLGKISPKYIRLEPYIPAFSELELLAKDIGICINPEARIYCPPNVGSYVGGDIISGILASSMNKDNKIRLFIDIGTNGEIVLGNDEWLMSCACSAGPAFEGAGIKCGIRPIAGAIEHFVINPESLEPIYKTVESKPAKGICGSGLIDIIAELFKNKLIDRQGRFYENKTDRVIIKNNQKIYIISSKEIEGSDKQIYISEQDIKSVIRTKGAIFSGINSLLNYAGMEFSEIDEILVAGGIGKYINFENAIKIGLFPDLPIEKYKYIGNSSLNGAYLLLLNIKYFDELKVIVSMMNYFDISEDSEYMSFFISSLFIPHTNMGLFPSCR